MIQLSVSFKEFVVRHVHCYSSGTNITTCYLIKLSSLALIYVPKHFIDILQIGCGFVRTTTNIFVCNYSPPGNIIHNNVPLPAYEVMPNGLSLFHKFFIH